jgi:hypothetical protein
VTSDYQPGPVAGFAPEGRNGSCPSVLIDGVEVVVLDAADRRTVQALWLGSLVNLDPATTATPVTHPLRQADMLRGAVATLYRLATDRASGGRRAIASLETFRANLRGYMVRWTAGTVTADVLAGVEYPALIAGGYTAVGGVLARFDRTTVELIAADLAILRAGAMPGEHPSVGLRGDVAVVAWDHDTGARATAPEMDQVHPDHGGRYSLGAYLWPWRAVESQP